MACIALRANTHAHSRSLPRSPRPRRDEKAPMLVEQVGFAGSVAKMFGHLLEGRKLLFRNRL
jgi:hypothetical protein